MQSFYDYKKFAILYVDDEEKSLKYFKEAFGEKFRVFTAPNAQEGFDLLAKRQDEIGVLMTDQRMPGEKGVQFLEKVRQMNPKILRILVTAYSDLETAIEAVNTGAIYKYITKPWDLPQLETTLMRGLEFFIVQKERDGLLREKMSSLHRMMITDRVMSLGVLASGLSHHIRNSMVAVKTFLDLAPKKLEEERLDLEALKNPDFWKEYYVKVQSQIDKINGLLSQLCEVSEKPKADFPDEQKLEKAVGDAVARAKDRLSAGKITVENKVPAGLPALKVDGAKFNRLFDLLLEEETLYLPQGAKVTFTAEALGQDRVQIRIQDNGPGLAPESLAWIFDPFYVRNNNPQEYGVNLLAAFFIVYHHGGMIEAKSAPGQGLSFLITFPKDPFQSLEKQDDREFIKKVLFNEALWEKLLSES